MRYSSSIVLTIAIILSISIGLGISKYRDCTNRVVPTHVYVPGEKVIHKVTNETVRVTTVWSLFRGPACVRQYYGKYTIRFTDGAEIDAEWNQLKPILK